MTRLVVMFSISGLRQRERSDGGRTPSHRFELERQSLLEAECSTWYGQIPAKTVHCMSFLLCSRWCSSSSGRSSILIFHKDGTCRFFFACLKLYVTGTTGIQVFLLAISLFSTCPLQLSVWYQLDGKRTCWRSRGVSVYRNLLFVRFS